MGVIYPRFRRLTLLGWISHKKYSTGNVFASLIRSYNHTLPVALTCFHHTRNRMQAYNYLLFHVEWPKPGHNPSSYQVGPLLLGNTNTPPVPNFGGRNQPRASING